MSAMELKNYGYAIQICQGILQTLPDFLDGRKMARKAAFEKAKTVRKSFFSLGGGVSLGLMKASSLLKKNDLTALLPALEEILADDPFNAQANTCLLYTSPSPRD